MKNFQFLILWFCSPIVLYCCSDSRSGDVILRESIVKDSLENKDEREYSGDINYVQVKNADFKLDTVDKSELNSTFQILTIDHEIFLEISHNTQASTLIIDDTEIPIEFNFFYDTDLESALEEIKLLKTNYSKDLILLFPKTTEEYLTFEVIKFYSAKKNFLKGEFVIDTHRFKNVRNYYLMHSMKITEGESSCIISIGPFDQKVILRKSD